MTFQAQKYPKTRISIRLTNENYDYLYVLARKWDTSIASALNRVVKESGITFCISANTNDRIREADYAR